MIETQYITLNMVPSGVLPVLYCSQYDIGRPLGMVVYNGGEAVNLGDYTVTIEATRTDGAAITAAVTTDGNIGAFETTATMTNKADRYGAQLVMTASGQRVASLPFVMCVVRAAMDENAESIEEDASLYQQYTETVQTLIADIRSAVNAETSRAEAAEASLQSAISAEASARQTLANDLSAETAARQSADTSIENDISAINTTLASETSSRTAADTNLQNQINQIVAPTGEAPSAAEVQNARIGADGVTYNTLGDAIRTQFTNLKSNVSEISIIEKFRETQGLGYFVNGVNFTIVYNSSNINITNKELLYSEHPVKISVDTGYKYIVATYSNYTANAANHIANTAWQTGEYVVPARTWFTVQLRNTDNTTALTENDKTKLKIHDLVYIDDFDNLQEQIDRINEKPTLYHIIVTGQSLANGSEGNPALTTLTPFAFIGKAFRFNGGARPTDGMENNTGVEEISMLDKCCGYFDSLCEQDHTITIGTGGTARDVTIGETISSALGFWFYRDTGEMCLVSNHGLGGKDYNSLKKGTTAYQNSLRAVRHAKALCDEKKWNYVVYAIAVVHGEADLYGGVSEDTYKNYLKEWQNDYDYDIKAITGQTNTIQLFASQTVASSAYNLETNPIANAVFKASLEDADIHLVGPQYAYPIEYASIHMNNVGYRALGEMFGFAIIRKFLNRNSAALYPTKSVQSGNTVTITFNSFGDLTFDTNNVAAVSDGHYGFELLNDSNNRSITNVTINGNTVVITLDGTPSSDAYISYAYKTLTDEMGNIGRQNGVRGNLRTTGGYNSMFPPNYLYCPMWCAVFSVPVNWTA